MVVHRNGGGGHGGGGGGYGGGGHGGGHSAPQLKIVKVISKLPINQINKFEPLNKISILFCYNLFDI